MKSKEQSNGSRKLTNIESEQILLGCILKEKGLISEVRKYIEPKHFYQEKDKIIYRITTDMDEKRDPIDETTVYSELREKGQEESVGGFRYLAYLTDLAISTANWKYHMNKTLEAYKKCSLWKLTQGISDKLVTGEIGVENAMTTLKNKTEEMITAKERKLKIVYASDLPDEPSMKPLWEGGFPYHGTITQINSKPGVGKTTFAYNLSALGSQGRQFLGLNFTRALKILYIDTETPSWLRKPKLRIIDGFVASNNLAFLDWIDINKDLSELKTLCKNENFDVVIFDTQSRLLQMREENDNAEANRIMCKLRQLTEDTGCALILIHHMGISERNSVYGGRGASAVAGAVDVVVNMQECDEEIIRLKVSKNRIVGNYNELYIRKIDGGFEPFTPPDHKSGFEIYKAENFIVQLLSDGALWNTSEIKEKGIANGYHEKTIERSLKKLVNLSRLERVKKGVYRLMDGEKSPSYLVESNIAENSNGLADSDIADEIAA